MFFLPPDVAVTVFHCYLSQLNIQSYCNPYVLSSDVYLQLGEPNVSSGF